MKKIISTVAALGLVVGVAGTASAVDYTMTGKYVLEGYMMNGADGAGVSTMDDAGTDSAWVQTFLVKPTITVNDKIKMFGEVRFAKDSDWGDDPKGSGDGYDSVNDIDVEYVYMEYMSELGKVRMGRTPAGAWGSDFLSTTANANRLMWWPSFVAQPFSLVVFTQKTAENDWDNSSSDSDNDLYEIALDYKVDGLLAQVGYDYINNKTNSTYDSQYSLFKANLAMAAGPVNIGGEFGWYFGDAQDFDASTATDVDVDAMGLMLDVNTKLDTLTVGGMYFWAQGDDDATDDDQEAIMVSTSSGIGDDFNPLYILTGDHTNVFNDDEYPGGNPTLYNAGVHALAVYADLAVSDKLTLHSVLGYAFADTTDRLETPGNDVDDEYGWELNLGAKYKLLDNLTYEAHAGYVFTGDFFEDALGNENDEDIYLLSHHLTMTF